MSRILVTGGAGYIGSHTCVELLAAGHEVVVVDNLDNASEEALVRVRELAGLTADDRRLVFHRVDCCDAPALAQVFADGPADRPIAAVIHFAGLKAVGESTQVPLRYYRNNLIATLNLLDQMAAQGCRRLVFSSSATVYGDPDTVPITEDAPLRTTNPYGRTKLVIEDMLRDLCVAQDDWQVVLLRYFNPVGAHPSGRIGEDPQGIPNNLMPFIAQVAVGRREQLQVFGDDWPTPDGTGVRDYIHVVDLARGHVAALDHIAAIKGCRAINLGTGCGRSVLEMLRAFECASGKSVPYVIVDRRPGDVAACWADPSTAARELGWRAELGIDAMCADTWRWQQTNPQGYRG